MSGARAETEATSGAGPRAHDAGAQPELVALATEVLERALAAGADEVQVSAQRSEERRVGFERNELNLAAGGEETQLAIKVHVDHRLGSAMTNATSSEDLDAAVRAAIELARFAPPDEYLCLPKPRPVVPSDVRRDAALEVLDPRALVRMAREFLSALRADPRMSVDAGHVAWEVGEECIVSSLGVRVADRWTRLDWSAAAQALDGDEVTSFDYLGGMSYRLAGADARVVADGERLARDVLATFGAEQVESYRGPVLLSPRAIEELILDPLEYHLSGLEVAYDKSSLPDAKVGTIVASPLFTLVDDPTDLELDGCASYDEEGMPAVTTDFIRGGRLERHMENAYSAKRRGKTHTGHAGLGFHAPVVFPKGTPLEKLLVPSGGDPLLVVHRFSGNVDGSSGDFSGVAKGSYAITPGGLRMPVKETMIAGNLFEMLNAILAVENRSEVVDGRLRTPHVLVDGLSVTGEE